MQYLPQHLVEAHVTEDGVDKDISQPVYEPAHNLT